MYMLKQVSRVFQSSVQIPIDDSSKIVLVSDCHRGDGSMADDFEPNENIYLSALAHYDHEKYTYIEIGDGDELWENKKITEIINAHRSSFQMLKKLYDDGRLYFIYGNHDMVKRNPRYVKANMEQYYDRREKKEIPLFQDIIVHEGLVLVYQNTNAGKEPNIKNELTEKKILLIHGHQVDFLNSSLWRLSRFLVRYLWRPLELFGINNPTSPAKNQEKKETVGKKLTEWVVKERHMMIAGHNHRPMFPEIGEPIYFNSGTWSHPRLITAIEISDGKIQLVKWGVMAKEDGSLYIGREVLDGPRKLEDYFRSVENGQRVLTVLSKKDYDILS